MSDTPSEPRLFRIVRVDPSDGGRKVITEYDDPAVLVDELPIFRSGELERYRVEVPGVLPGTSSDMTVIEFLAKYRVAATAATARATDQEQTLMSPSASVPRRWEAVRAPADDVTRLRGVFTKVIYRRVESDTQRWYPVDGGQTRTFADLLCFEGRLDDATPGQPEPGPFDGSKGYMRKVTADEVLGQLGGGPEGPLALHRAVLPAAIALIESLGYVIADLDD